MSSDLIDQMRNFVNYVYSLSGYEKGEAQVFCDRLFRAFGHNGYKEAGAQLEFQVRRRRGRGTKFADLLWRPRVLIEMKSRGEDLAKHYHQAFEYWIEIVPDRPRYVVLCNFDEFWIYDFNTQLDSPVDKLNVSELPERYIALNFLFPSNPKPLFGNDKVKVTREAADRVAQVFNALTSRGESREESQRFILQCVVAMFSEDFDLLPRGFFSTILNDCIEAGESTYDLLGGLFKQMADPTPARGGRFKGVKYFNGGLFKHVEPMELTHDECKLLFEASSQNWSSVAPPIFGTLLQNSMDKNQRHALGAHFTNEADIQKVVLPSIVIPWKERIDAASTFKELDSLSREILNYRVLDPACGSGNFLYVAYRELVNLEMEILRKIHENFGARSRKIAGSQSLVSTKQFYGIDKDPFAVELAKVTLMLGKRTVLSETQNSQFAKQQDLPFNFEEPLPLDNLDDSIIADDALFCTWPRANVIVGNPPYQSKNKIVKDLGRQYVDSVRSKFPEVSGRADYCVYWFRRAHQELPEGGRAGLVGTNTIRQNYSREGGLDYILNNGGDITQAVSTQNWSGDAAVHVSIVNWIKGSDKCIRKLFKQTGVDPDGPWEIFELEHINSALSPGADVTKAHSLRVNSDSGACFQGQTHGHAGFILSPAQKTTLASDPRAENVIHPYMTGEELLKHNGPQRWVIDLSPCEDLIAAMNHSSAFMQVKELVMPDILKKAKKERADLGGKTGPRQNHAKRWWRFWRPRSELIAEISKLQRYIVCPRVTKRPVFAFVSANVRPNDALQIFPLDDDYSFGILQSICHWEWFTERCSTLSDTFRYTSNTVFDSFPWPQTPSEDQIAQIANAARELRQERTHVLRHQGLSLRDLYRSMELPGENRLKRLHERLDSEVRSAYGMSRRDNTVKYLFELNQMLYDQEQTGKNVTGPGLPRSVTTPQEFVTGDCFPL